MTYVYKPLAFWCEICTNVCRTYNLNKQNRKTTTHRLFLKANNKSNHREKKKWQYLIVTHCEAQQQQPKKKKTKEATNNWWINTNKILFNEIYLDCITMNVNNEHVCMFARVKNKDWKKDAIILVNKVKIQTNQMRNALKTGKSQDNSL